MKLKTLVSLKDKDGQNVKIEPFVGHYNQQVTFHKKNGVFLYVLSGIFVVVLFCVIQKIATPEASEKAIAIS